MPYAYCTTCKRQVLIHPGGLCPEGHAVGRRRGGKHRAPPNRRVARPQRRVTAPAVDRPRPSPASASPPIAYDSTLIEMFGFSESPPLRPAATAVLPKPEPEPLPGLPALKEMRRPTDAAGDTGALVTRLWAATETFTPSADWKPESFDSLAASARTFRWSIVIASLVLLFAGLSLIRWASSMPERAAAAATTSYLSATAAFENQLPETRQTVATVTDIDAGTTQLADAAVSLSKLDESARRLFEVAADPLPSVLPLISRSPLEALTPARRAMGTASEIGLTLERRLGDALSYRLVFGRAFRLPPLVTTASQQEIATLGVSLGLAVTDTQEAVEKLPGEPFFANHLLASQQLALRLDNWQVEYLDALRKGDETTASLLIQEIQQKVAALDAGVEAPLATLNNWAETQLSTLQIQLDTISGQLG
ncbi:hypothetical protein BMS3Abin02_01531 [bacterium BMS3Abin02]|nr:hypothetical protein BMS3Abin02_01531 [bacterium BMS3Abin02]